jgi:hypothetical protein
VVETGQRRTEGWYAATTIDPLAGDETDSDGMAIIRFSSQLLPGQPQTISIPAAVSIQRASLWIRRVAERIELEAEAALHELMDPPTRFLANVPSVF